MPNQEWAYVLCHARVVQVQQVAADELKKHFGRLLLGGKGSCGTRDTLVHLR